jgi:hypothetical protein
MQGNTSDTVNNISFSDIDVTADDPILRTKYTDIKLTNAIVNGAPMVTK